MIPSQGGYQMTNWNDASESYPGRSDYGTIPQGIVNAVPLQAVLPSSSQPYVPYSAYQKSIPTKELTNELVSRDPNESLLLTLTKKMSELAVNLAKDKEKRHKPTNMRPNVWCSNCKEQDHLVTECSSPPQMMVQCTFCGSKHTTANCWNLRKQQQVGQQTMSQPTSWNMQTSQPAEDKGPVQWDSPVHHIEVVNAVLTKGQQKGKNPIQDLDDPIEVTTVAPSTRRTEPISVLGRIPILSPQQDEEPNSILRANFSGTSRSIPNDHVPIPAQPNISSYPLKEPLVVEESTKRKELLPNRVKTKPMKRKRALGSFIMSREKVKRASEKEEEGRRVRSRSNMDELSLCILTNMEPIQLEICWNATREKDFGSAQLYPFLRVAENLPSIDVEILEEYLTNYDLEDGSSVVKGMTLRIDENTLHKALQLPIVELAVGVEESSDFNLGSYFKGGMTSLERNQGWRTADALTPKLMEWMRFIQKRLGLNRHMTYMAKRLLYATIGSFEGMSTIIYELSQSLLEKGKTIAAPVLPKPRSNLLALLWGPGETSQQAGEPISVRERGPMAQRDNRPVDIQHRTPEENSVKERFLTKMATLEQEKKTMSDQFRVKTEEMQGEINTLKEVAKKLVEELVSVRWPQGSIDGSIGKLEQKVKQQQHQLEAKDTRILQLESQVRELGALNEDLTARLNIVPINVSDGKVEEVTLEL
uniref:Predicted protein n=1 Tax=Physcomitrium patens TaxID=3218 RepID=A9U3M7_PHYPA